MNRLTRKRIPQFIKYINKVFKFQPMAETMEDFRQNPDITAEQVFLSVFWMFQLRLRSFNALEPELADQMKKLIKTDRDRVASADTLAYSLKRFDLVGLEKKFFKINKKAKRNKVFQGGTLGGYIVAAMDGTEDFASENICCPKCSQREVEKVKQINGKKVKLKVNEYYHRDVLCQIIGSKPALVLGAEAQQRGEGETIAGARLVDKIVREYGKEFIDVLVVDALYKGPFIRHVRQYGWQVVAHIKDEKRNQLICDADGIFRQRKPDREGREQISSHHWVEYKIWDEEGFTSWPQAADLIRALKIWEQEKYYDREKDQLKIVREEVKWLAATLSKQQASSMVVYRMGRGRWWIENNGNRDLKTNWHMDHNFVHSDTALKAIRLILLIAFNLFNLFVYLQHRGYRETAMTVLQVAMELFKSYCGLQQKVWATGKRKRLYDKPATGGIDSS